MPLEMDIAHLIASYLITEPHTDKNMLRRSYGHTYGG